MKTKQKIITAAVLAALGTSAATPGTASAAILADGYYNLYINVTPTGTTSYGGTYYKVGTDGAWNSSFSYGGNAPSAGSIGLTDNGVLVTAGDGGLRGTSIAGDGYAGHWVISVIGSNVSVISFSSDTTLGSVLGNAAQYGTVTGGGTIDQTTGAMTLTPTGRLAASSHFPALYDKPFYVDNLDCTTSGCVSNGNTAWSSLTTTSATTSGFSGPATINGAPVTALGDIDGDGLADYSAILVSGGEFGDQWGGFAGAPFLEVKNILLEYASPIPIPPAVWLFGSGLLGLVAMARRHRRQK